MRRSNSRCSVHQALSDLSAFLNSTDDNEHDVIVSSLFPPIPQSSSLPRKEGRFTWLSNVVDDVLPSRAFLGLSALRFVVECGEAQLALKLVRRRQSKHQHCRGSGHFEHNTVVFSRGADGYNVLHAAIVAQIDEVVQELILQGSSTSKNLLLRQTTLDIRYPLNMDMDSGGKTALHLAAQRGQFSYVQLLVDAGCDVNAQDWDDATPLWYALQHNYTKVAEYLRQRGGKSGGMSSSERKRKRNQRYTAFLHPKGNWATILHQKQLWSKDECETVLKAVLSTADSEGWQTTRHQSYATTDLPSYFVLEVDGWVRSSLYQRLWPLLYESYEVLPEDVEFRELFYVKYEFSNENSDVQTQANLALHRDGSLLSFNILLNSSEEFDGGGTYFDALKEVSKWRCYVNRIYQGTHL